MEKISEVLYSTIEDEEGRQLGRLFDLRSDGEPEHGISNQSRPITEIVYGVRGFWEMIGLRKPTPITIPWSSVVKIDGGKIIVSQNNEAAPRS